MVFIFVNYIFTELKKIFYIITFTVLMHLGGFSQQGTSTDDPVVRFIKYYPNPASSYINFEFQKSFDKSYSFQIFNFIGKKVVDLKTISQRMNLSLSDFYRGIYIYQLLDRSGKILESGKFQVIK
ncbi:hypothetical protein BH09BAC2_BH09BAC2_22360 [soil metagenome]